MDERLAREALARPEILGAMLERSLGAGERRAYGAHFTGQDDILEIVRPTIVEPWTDRIEAARTPDELLRLADRLQRFRVLDPACGSGNFLYVAYREVKRIEARLRERLAEMSGHPVEPPRAVSAASFLGIDVNPTAVELARLTMTIAQKLAAAELCLDEPELVPRDLDASFLVADALVDEDGRPLRWPACDVIIGNPPFLGAKRLKPERGDAYVERLRRAYPDVPGMADYCVYWFRRAHDHLPPCTEEDPLAGRAGLVGTQSIRSNRSRAGGLDHIVVGGTIVEAVDNQPWSGDAAVHVSIVNWVKTTAPSLLPAARRLWIATPEGRELRRCARISSSLSDAVDLSSAASLRCNRDPQRVFQGVTPGYAGFVLDAAERRAIAARSPELSRYLPGYLIGRELMTGDGRPRRYLVDLDGLDLAGAQATGELHDLLHHRVHAHVERAHVREAAKRSGMEPARREHLDRWWTFWARRTELRAWMGRHARIIASSRTQRSPFAFELVSTRGWLPGDKIQLFAFDDDYSFGVIQSSAHARWYAAIATRLKNEVDYNYSSAGVFATFPWPEAPSAAMVAGVAEAAVRLRAVRRQERARLGLGLRDLYATLLSPGTSALHAAQSALDEAVYAAYGFAADDDPLAALLALNASIAAREAEGLPVTPPGLPPCVPAGAFVTEDCLHGDEGERYAHP